jgi:hypothetical protein
MARRKQNKSELIRQALADLGPEARNRDVITLLRAKRVKVSAQMVSTVRSRASGTAAAKGRRPKRKGRRGRRVAAESVSLPALLEARKLVNEAGSVEAAREALATLARLV